MAEKHVTANIRKKSVELLWKPLSDKYGYGTPDRCFLDTKTARVGFCELKYIAALPAKKCKVGLKGKQASWLKEWKQNGGKAFLVVGIGSNKLAIFTDNFYAIAKDGVLRSEFNLVTYDELEAVLKALLG